MKTSAPRGDPESINTKSKTQLSPIESKLVSSNPSLIEEKMEHECSAGKTIVDQLEEINSQIKLGIWEGNEQGGSSSVAKQNQAIVIVSPRSP